MSTTIVKDTISVSSLSKPKSSDSRRSAGTGRKLLEAETEFRRMYIVRTLRQTSSKAEAAQMLGINRTHFYKLLSQLEIDL
jgi:DNA-binding NtrC family response regulator